MTVILFTVILTSIIGYYFSKMIRNFAIYIYGIMILISLVIGSHEANIISLGYVPFGIFLVVMFMGVLDKGEFKNRLLNIRGELAIIGFILLVPHAFGYFEYYAETLGILTGSGSFYIGILAFLTSVPLVATSFRKIRSKIGYPKWKKLHNFSYLFYLLIATHIILISNERQLTYLIIFVVYTVMKIYVLVNQSIQRQNRVKQRIAIKKTSIVE